VCKGARLYNGYLASKNDHDSWETCTTSTEYRTVIIAVLTVMSGMDPHMISGNVEWVGLFGSVQVILSVRSTLHSGLCGVIDDPVSRS
jgi:hypothetical protein